MTFIVILSLGYGDYIWHNRLTAVNASAMHAQTVSYLIVGEHSSRKGVGEGLGDGLDTGADLIFGRVLHAETAAVHRYSDDDLVFGRTKTRPHFGCRVLWRSDNVVTYRTFKRTHRVRGIVFT